MNMLKQVDKDYIPFGFQYYRSPTPYRDQWETDLRNIANKGFNCVKYWVQWRASQPTEHTFVFDDVLELMDLAHKNGLKVVLNVIFDVAPSWFYKHYPDSVMITADGVRLEPRAINCRQIGGAPGPCYHHPAGKLEKDRFLYAAVTAFKDHPALWVWDLWNEPELTTSIKRELHFNNQVCYCNNSMLEFGEWLQRKYMNIEQLNVKWQRNYMDWSEIEAPRGKAVFNDLVDWRLFMSDALSDDLHQRASLVRILDTVHPVMVHTVPGPIFNLITAGSDDFKLAKSCDLFGNSLGSSAWSADLLMSAAKGKKVINSEIHALPGDTSLKPKKLDWRELKQHIFIPLARGITGYLFWQYRPEILGQEAPAWGSTFLDGSDTPWLDDMAKLNNQIQQAAEHLTHGIRPSDRIAVWYSSENQIANYAAFGHLDTYFESVQGVHQLLHDLNYKVEFLHDDDMNSETLANYTCLWLPFPLYMNEKLCEVIREWVERGGILISECSFAALQAEKGTHSYQVPGYGFNKVFGVTETWIHSVQHLSHSYADATIRSNTRIPIVHVSNSQTNKLHGSYYKTDIEVMPHVSIVAHFEEDERPAITIANYGHGKAIWIGTLLASVYWHDREATIRNLIQKILLEINIMPHIRVLSNGVRADLLRRDEEDVHTAQLFIHCWNNSPTQAIVEVPGNYSHVQCWFEETEAELEVKANNYTQIKLYMEPGDIFALILT